MAPTVVQLITVPGIDQSRINQLMTLMLEPDSSEGSDNKEREAITVALLDALRDLVLSDPNNSALSAEFAAGKPMNTFLVKFPLQAST